MAGLTRMAEIMENTGDVITANLTRPANVTAYVANDVVNNAVADVLEFDTGFTEGTNILITTVKLRIDIAAVPSGMEGFRLYLYNAEPTPLDDNAAFDVIEADKDKLIDYVDVDTPIDIGSRIFATTKSINAQIKLSTEDSKFYAQLVTLGGYTPSSGDVFQIDVGITDW